MAAFTWWLVTATLASGEANGEVMLHGEGGDVEDAGAAPWS